LSKNYRIYCLAAGAVRTLIQTVGQDELPRLMPAVFPILIFCLETDGLWILVDTGAPDPASLKHALARVGAQPADIDTVILTHLHFDHCANTELFPAARLIVQKKEWEFAHHPIESQRDIYVPQLIDMVGERNLVLVDDNYEAAEGVAVHLVPGHTAGQQAVSVSTVEGTYVLAGDLFSSFFGIDPAVHELIDLTGKRIPIQVSPGQNFYPPDIRSDLNEFYKSADKLLTISGSRDRIIPSHDPSLPGKVFPLGLQRSQG
jgi:glyoxylase-like metal-dependent hydrolase (beta-lactamase superfamily II)